MRTNSYRRLFDKKTLQVFRPYHENLPGHLDVFGTGPLDATPMLRLGRTVVRGRFWQYASLSISKSVMCQAESEPI